MILKGSSKKQKDMTRVGFEPTPLSRHGDSCIPSGSGGPEPCALDQLGHLANLDGRSEQFWNYEGIPSLCCSIFILIMEHLQNL
ncbi:hypothetical protein N7497_004409 [Penicillium chrysogenum]|nr:hypothetical protein N7497_004409 [Penicillium chrysogenum]